MNWATTRTARTHHRCACGNAIAPGDRYIDHRCAPNDPDLNNGRWWRATECAECATRYGRMEAAA